MMINKREWNVDHNQTVKVSNGELRYAIIGKGEPVICIHGTTLADSLITPLQLYPKLFEDYQFISYYRAGYNGSTLDKDSLSISEGAEHVKQLLDHLGIKKAHLVSFSFGGVIGFQFMLSHPDYLLSSTLIEPYLPRESEEAINANTAAFMKAFELYQKGDKIGAGLQYMEDVCGPRFFASVDMTGPLDIWERMKQGIETTFTIDFPAISSWDFKMSEAENTIKEKPTMPILAMMGLDSEAVMPGFRETQAFLMRFFPHAKRCGILGASHGMQSMNPLAVGESIYLFLKSIK
jgi:pimeloyl-ACP methyl ester carboxylesterase